MASEEAPVPDFRGHSDLQQAAALGQVAPLNFVAGHKVTAEGFHHMKSSGGDPGGHVRKSYGISRRNHENTLLELGDNSGCSPELEECTA